MASVPLINGKAYDWGMIDVQLPGFDDIQLQSIEYDDEVERELVYGRGYAPRGYGNGNYKPTAKISLLRDDFNELLAECKKKGKTLYGLEIPKIVVSYGNDDAHITTDVISNVLFQKTAHSNSQNDKSLKVDLDLFVYGKIVRDGVEPL